MRRAGFLLSIVALVAVQAPWMACGCSDDASFAPLLMGLFGHEQAERCCEPEAHIAHGKRHEHACGRACTHASAAAQHFASGPHDEATPHCHGHAPASLPSEVPAPSEHVAFRLPLSVIAPAAMLPAAAPQLQPLALLFDAAPVLEAAATVQAPEAAPPLAAQPPCLRTERLLL